MSDTRTDVQRMEAFGGRIDGITTQLKDMETSANYGETAGNVKNLATTVVSCIDKFKSDDSMEVAGAAFDLISAATAFIPGPVGMAISTICGIFGSIFGGQGPSELEQVSEHIDARFDALLEDIKNALKDLSEEIIDAIEKQAVTDLIGKSQSVFAEMSVTSSRLVNFLKMSDLHWDGHNNERLVLETLTSNTVLQSGVGFMAELWSRYEAMEDQRDAEVKSKFLVLYMRLGYMRSMQLFFMHLLYKRLGADDNLSGIEDIENMTETSANTIRENIKDFVKQPRTMSNVFTYKALHQVVPLKDRCQLIAYAKFLDVPFEGVLATIRVVASPSVLVQARLFMGVDEDVPGSKPSLGLTTAKSMDIFCFGEKEDIHRYPGYLMAMYPLMAGAHWARPMLYLKAEHYFTERKKRGRSGMQWLVFSNPQEYISVVIAANDLDFPNGVFYLQGSDGNPIFSLSSEEQYLEVFQGLPGDFPSPAHLIF
jgi:hypothetical protein